MASTAAKLLLLMGNAAPDFAALIRSLNPLIWASMTATFGTTETNIGYTGGSGPNLIVDGDFTNGLTGWTILNDNGGTRHISALNPGMRFVSDNTAALEARQTVLTVGDTYDLSVNVDVNTNASAKLQASTFRNTLSLGPYRSPYRFRDIAANALFRIRGQSSAPWDMTLANTIGIDCHKISEFDAFITSCTLGQSGATGGNHAFLFDGAASLLTITNKASLQGMVNPSLWVFCKPSGTGEGNKGTLFSKASEFELRFNSASGDLIATVNYSTTNAVATTSTTISLNAWHTIGLRVNADKSLSIFIDGVEASYASRTTGVGTRTSNTNDLIIGNESGATQTFAGLIDEYLLKDVIWTDAQFTTLDTKVRARSLPASPDNNIRHFLPVGDSKTNAALYNTDYPNILIRTMGYRYPTMQWIEDGARTFATGGFTVGDIAGAIDGWIAAFPSIRPAYALIDAGVNDCGSLPAKATWKGNYQYIISALTTAYPGIRIYIAHIARKNFDADCATMNGWIDELIAGNSNCSAGIDENVTLKGNDNFATNSDDGTHPNGVGTQVEVPAWIAAIGY